MHKGFETVIGIETHIELSTRSKVFCGCTTEFGGEPNSHCCPVCIGLPGSLPRLNKRAVEYAVLAALSLGCKITETVIMDRKNYVYPDLAKAYQISQLEAPIGREGRVTLEGGKVIRINRLHLEEDAGKLLHQKGKLYIDYNRAGVPLIEIVTEPDFSGAAEVKEYVELLRLTMLYLGVSDVKMQEGSLRCDVNVSVRERGEERLGTRTEIKNMNSVSFIVKAIEFESRRQIDALSEGGRIVQETRRYDEASGETESMREKEDSHDYRYFKDPDLPAIDLRGIERDMKKLLEGVELPSERLSRYMSELKLTKLESMQIIAYPRLAEYFERLVKAGGDARLCFNILTGHLFRYLTDEEKKARAEVPASAEAVAEVVRMVSSGKLSNNFIKKVIDKMCETHKSFSELFTEADFAGVGTDALEAAADEAIRENKKAADDVRAGKEKAIFAIVGAVMKKLGGKASAVSVCEIVKERIFRAGQ
jgi:aspartyl-tRNA(Asn)/glutamyl-tRNA(Gln) amidotransferase subunit B